MKHLLKITDLEKSEIQEILEISKKQMKACHGEPLQGKNILFAFEKPSLRTKVGTEVAINKLGGHVLHVDAENFFGGKILHAKNQDPSGNREDLKDTVKNVSQWCDGIFARVFSHQTLVEMTQYSEIPIINALCDFHHPMQALADLKTIQDVWELKENKKNKIPKISFIGDANNVARSLIEICLIFGYDVRFAGPKKYFWDEKSIKVFKKLEKKYSGNLLLTHESKIAVENTDFVYTDTFVSMGEEDIYEEKTSDFKDFKINKKLMENSNNAHFMHCLPAHRNIEVTDEVMDSDNSIIYNQAKNRMLTSLGVFTYFCK